jgi:hypothetical protein
MHFLKKHLNSKDWIAQWYLVAKERGSNTNAIVARKNLNTGKVEEHIFCHSKHDGMGFMLNWFKKENIELDIPLDAKFTEKVSFWKNLHKVFNGLTQVQVNKIAWKKQDLAAGSKIEAKSETLFFTKEETNQIANYLKDKPYSENAYFLAIVNNYLMPILKQDNSSGKWLFPINMRGNVHRDNIEQNISSGIYITTTNETSPVEIKSKIKSGFINNEHWVNWWTFHVNILMSKKVMAKVSRKSSQNSFFYGSFSNMGKWNASMFRDAKDLADYCYYVVPPGTANYPISLGIVTWFDLLTITLKLHPSILPNQDELKIHADKIKQLLLKPTRP